MPIKAKEPIFRTAATFDNIDVVDIRFRKIGDNWKGIVKYQLLDVGGESDGEFYDKQIPVTDNEIKKMEKLIAKIVDGTII